MENMLLGFELTIIGMGTVFISLYLLSVFLFFSGKLLGPDSKFDRRSGKNNKDKKTLSKNNKANGSNKLPSKLVAIITSVIYQNLDKQNNYSINSIEKNN